MTDHLPVGVQVSCAAVVAHCGRRDALKPASVPKCEAVNEEEFGRRVCPTNHRREECNLEVRTSVHHQMHCGLL